MPELGPRIPENLTGQSQESISHLTEKLTQTLAALPVDANFKTDEMIKQDGSFLRNRLKGGLLGFGRKRANVDLNDPDDLWVATHILYSKAEALKMYLISSSALIQADGGNVEGWTAENIHNELIKEGNEWLDYLNNRQIINGENAVLKLLDDLIKEQPAKEEAKESKIETADHAVLDLFAAINRGGRAENQDYVVYWRPKTPEEAQKFGWGFTKYETKTLGNGNIIVVADGVGGSVDGARASKEAGNGIVYSFKDTDYSEEPLSFLKRALTDANEAIYKAGPEGAGSMSTTVVAALIRGHNLYLAHAGDSRAYILRNGMLHRLTRDHSWVEEIEDGKRTLQQFRARYPERTNPTRNIITRSIGGKPQLEVDDVLQGPIPLIKGDKILLCTDGLWGPVNDQTIAAILSRSKDPQGAVTQLITEAVYNGGEHADNIGVAVINVEKLVKGKV